MDEVKGLMMQAPVTPVVHKVKDDERSNDLRRHHHCMPGTSQASKAAPMKPIGSPRTSVITACFFASEVTLASGLDASPRFATVDFALRKQIILIDAIKDD